MFKVGYFADNNLYMNDSINCPSIEQAESVAKVLAARKKTSFVGVWDGGDLLRVAIHYGGADSVLLAATERQWGDDSDLYASHFYIADHTPLFPGYTKLEEWNGAAVPYFTQATMIEIIEHFQDVWGGDVTGLEIGQGGEIIVKMVEHPPDVFTPDLDGLYRFEGWTWYELD